MKRCVAPMLCKNSPARKFLNTPFEQRGSDETARIRATCHEVCLFLLPRLAPETLRGAYALQKLAREKVFQTHPSNSEVPTKRRIYRTSSADISCRRTVSGAAAMSDCSKAADWDWHGVSTNEHSGTGSGRSHEGWPCRDLRRDKAKLARKTEVV